jgi:hypothetical protein
VKKITFAKSYFVYLGRLEAVLVRASANPKGMPNGRKVFHIITFQIQRGGGSRDHADGVFDQFGICHRHPGATPGLHA